MFHAATAACWLLLCVALRAQTNLCEPTPEIRGEIEKAAAAPADGQIAAFVRLREAHPKDLFVHMRYQDAVEEREQGLQGLLTNMLHEYERISAGSNGSTFEMYLLGRALEGISTLQTISHMNQILEKDPGYAPAHRTLAEIYGSKAFRDPEKERIARAKFAGLCPGSTIASRPYPLPPTSPLLDQADALLKQGAGLSRIPSLVEEAMRQNNWRMQRMRPFEWYTAEEKKAAAREVQEGYWTGWGILAEYYSKTGQTEKAQEQLAAMEQRFASLRRDQISTWWKAGTLLADLFHRAKQPVKVREVLDRMAGYLAQKPDDTRGAQLEKLRQKYGIGTS